MANILSECHVVQHTWLVTLCFEPKGPLCVLSCACPTTQDLVIPSPKFPAHYRWSPLLGAPAQQRDTLLYFRGDVGADRKPNYSRGIRQRLHALARTSEWREQLGVRIGTREELPGDYSRALASSIFCLVAPGEAAKQSFFVSSA